MMPSQLQSLNRTALTTGTNILTNYNYLILYPFFYNYPINFTITGITFRSGGKVCPIAKYLQLFTVAL